MKFIIEFIVGSLCFAFLYLIYIIVKQYFENSWWAVLVFILLLYIIFCTLKFIDVKYLVLLEKIENNQDKKE